MKKGRPLFDCRCGHVAYWVKYYGWHCMCGNPTTKSGIEKKSPRKGPLVR